MIISSQHIMVLGALSVETLTAKGVSYNIKQLSRNTYHILNYLASKGFVEISKQDTLESPHVKHYTITPKGRTLLELLK